MRQGSFAVIIEDNKVLLVRSSTNKELQDHWSFPGGLVEIGEKIEDAAIREVYEEVGIKCNIQELLSSRVNEEFNILVYIFRASYLSGKLKLQESEILEAKWFLLDDSIKVPLAYNSREVLMPLVTKVH